MLMLVIIHKVTFFLSLSHFPHLKGSSERKENNGSWTEHHWACAMKWYVSSVIEKEWWRNFVLILFYLESTTFQSETDMHLELYNNAFIFSLFRVYTKLRSFDNDKEVNESKKNDESVTCALQEDLAPEIACN